MLEPPSKQLLEHLRELGLCTPADLRRCRHHVRRVARDLPAFDSVWIDALVRARAVTPFQARLLESPQPKSLRVGPCVLVDRLGKSPRSETYLARRRDGRQRCVLKLIRCPPESREERLASLKKLVEAVRGASHPSLVVPHASLTHEDCLVAVSRPVAGLHLGELLVRRGRLAAAHVLDVARQLIDGLAWLEERGYAHGEITLWNVRLTSSGTAVLVDAGITPAVAPELTIHADRPPERYDGIAPELIGTGVAPNSASDIYALGCLLWHLLAGRPPHPTGDPLGKLAAHQTRTVSDVREWAPDTPPLLADAVRKLTSRDPHGRPASFREVREWLGAPGWSARKRLARFRASFNTALPKMPASRAFQLQAYRPPGGWTIVLTLLFVLSGATLMLADRGAWSDPLNVPQRMTDYVQHSLARWTGDARAAPRQDRQRGGSPFEDGKRVLPLPAPNADGEIVLDTPGPYAWRRIDAIDSLTIRGHSDVAPVIVVSRAPCRVVAQEATFENVHFRLDGRLSAAAGRNRPAALLLVQSQNVNVRRCSFDASGGGGSVATTQQDAGAARSPRRRAPAVAKSPVAVAWKMIDEQDPSGGGVALENTVFTLPTPALSCWSPPRRLECTNCLKLGPGPALVLRTPPRPAAAVSIELNRLTLRDAQSLLRIHLPAEWNGSTFTNLAVRADNCVFGLAGQHRALYQLVSSRIPDGDLPLVEMTGEGSIAPPGLVVAVQLDPDGDDPSTLDSRHVAVDGIAVGSFRFAGPASLDPRASRLESFEGPQLLVPGGPQAGIDASRLLVPRRPAPAADR